MHNYGTIITLKRTVGILVFVIFIQCMIIFQLYVVNRPLPVNIQFVNELKVLEKNLQRIITQAAPTGDEVSVSD